MTLIEERGLFAGLLLRETDGSAGSFYTLGRHCGCPLANSLTNGSVTSAPAQTPSRDERCELADWRLGRMGCNPRAFALAASLFSRDLASSASFHLRLASRLLCHSLSGSVLGVLVVLPRSLAL